MLRSLAGDRRRAIGVFPYGACGCLPNLVLLLPFAALAPVHDVGGRMAARRLHEPLAHPPLMLTQQDAAPLGEPVGRIVEHAEDRRAIGDRERGAPPLVVVGVLKRFRSVVEASVAEPAGELEHKPVGDGNTGEHHGRERTHVR
jgi:hypothetical protein